MAGMLICSLKGLSHYIRMVGKLYGLDRNSYRIKQLCIDVLQVSFISIKDALHIPVKLFAGHYLYTV